MREIRDRVLTMKPGSIFITADFADIADADTVRSALYRLVQNGKLRRIMNGVFEKPAFSQFLNEFVAVDPDAVAKALARNYRWTIAPSGNTALNLLGLSTQVPAVWSYISDGPYRTYRWNNTELEFKHRTNKEITGLSDMTVLVIQVLKTLGKNIITPDTIAIIRSRLNDKDMKIMLKEAIGCTDWVYATIRKICKGAHNE